MYLAYKQGYHTESWPGINTIHRDLGLAIQTVLESTERLCTAGLLRKTPGSRGRGHSHRYVVCLGKTSREQSFSGGGKSPESGISESEKSSAPHSEKFCSLEMNHSGNIQEECTAPYTDHSDAKRGKSRPGAETTKRGFTPPTEEEVRAYAASRGLSDFDAAYFIEYYTTADWHNVRGNPILNWKLKVVTWIKYDQARSRAQGQPTQNGYTEFGTHPATDEDIQRLREDRS